MKKIVVMMFFVLTSLSINATTIFSPNEGCMQYAANAADAEEAHYGEMCAYDWGETALWYYDLCVEAGGSDSILEPILL